MADGAEAPLTLRARAAVLFLLAAIAAQGMWAIVDKSPTCDEFSNHIASGYSYLVTRDFRLNPASPPLPRMLAALPLLFLHAAAPLQGRAWKTGNSPDFAHEFFYSANHRLDDFIFWARVPILLLSLLFALSVFFVAKGLLGEAGGLAALFLYAFCPDILAHSSLATADLAVAFFFFWAVVSFARYLKRPAWKTLAATGIFTGLALLSKFTAVLLFPLFILIALFAGKARELKIGRIAACLAVCFLTIWAGYGFEVKPLLQNTPQPEKKAAVYRQLGGERLLHFAEKTPVPLSTFSSAFVSMMHTRREGTNAYLMGHWSRSGWWYYYFVAFAIKNTLPFLILSVLGIIFLGRVGFDRVTVSMLTVPIVFFFIFTMPDKAQAGIRYFLPIYPLFMILAAAAAVHLWKKIPRARIAVGALLAWHAASAVFVAPSYLAYFNELIGGPSNGYKYLRDSNVDWGQDLKGLSKWAQREGYPEVVIHSITPAEPDSYGMAYRRFAPDEFERPRAAVYAVGAHFLNDVKWARSARPVKVIGYSFFVYDMRSRA